jgi:hypothetical protein
MNPVAISGSKKFSVPISGFGRFGFVRRISGRSQAAPHFPVFPDLIGFCAGACYSSMDLVLHSCLGAMSPSFSRF